MPVPDIIFLEITDPKVDADLHAEARAAGVPEGKVALQIVTMASRAGFIRGVMRRSLDPDTWGEGDLPQPATPSETERKPA